MGLLIIQSQWNGFKVDSLPPDITLNVTPEPGYPQGRYAFLLSQVWKRIRKNNIPGVLLMGHNIAADPDDYEAIAAAASLHPERVLTGMVKLWPISTGRAEWVWSHRGGTYGRPEAGQLDILRPAYVSTDFLYVPRQLMDLAFPMHADWTHMEIGMYLSGLAIQHRIATRVVYTAAPKNLYFSESHNR